MFDVLLRPFTEDAPDYEMLKWFVVVFLKVGHAKSLPHRTHGQPFFFFSCRLSGWPCHHFVQLDGNFLLEAGNRHFLIVSVLVNKTICVTTSDFCFIAENLRILKFCLLNYYDGKKCKISCSLIRSINYTTKKSVKNYI
jgi:hypothetical protein